MIADTSGHFKKMLVVLLQVCSPPDIMYILAVGTLLTIRLISVVLCGLMVAGDQG